MKTTLVSLFVGFLIALSMAQAGQLEARWPSRASTAQGLIVITHGWQPWGNTDAVRTGELGELYSAVESHIEEVPDWNLAAYHWETAAATGPILGGWSAYPALEGYINAMEAAAAGVGEGVTLANAIRDNYPEIDKIHLVAHSAGTWVMEQAIQLIVSRNPDIEVQLTLLDPFIPDSDLATYQLTETGLNVQRIKDILDKIGLNRTYLLENYFTVDVSGPATHQVFSWSNKGLNYHYTPALIGLPTGHSAPIVFYTNTVKYTQYPYPASLDGIDPTAVGWQKSMFFNEIAFSEEPESRDLISGQTAIFSATAFQRGRPSRPQADFTYQWEHYLNGSWQNLGGNQSLILVPTTASMSGRNYRVTASIGSESTVSRVVTLNLRDSTVASAPAAPTNLTALTASSNRINLKWTDKSSNESNFKVKRRLGGSSSWTEIATLPAGTQTYSSTGLAASTTYDYQVYAINSAGPSGISNTASARTSAPTTASYALTVNAVDLSALQTLAVTMYSWEGTSTDFRSNTTAFTRSAAAGKQITVSAPATLAGGRIFQYWLKDGSSREYNTSVTVTMDGQHLADAIYGTSPPPGRALQSISIVGPSSVDERTAASYSARATYTDGTTGTVSASWDESSSYVSISSNGLLDAAAVSSDKSVTIEASATISGITKTASKTITIRNVATAQTYTLTRNVVGEGSIGYSPQASQYAAGTVVSLHGNEDGGWLFSHWSGDASGSDDDTTVRMDGNRSVTAHFVADTSEGGLRVNLSPPQAVAETAQWKYRNYTAWRDSGNTQLNIPVGSGYVKFKDIPGWITPDEVQATILGGQTITVNASYREIKGAVQVSLTPPQAAEAGARWRLNGGPWQESGTTLAEAPTGTNSIEFLAIPGWGTPPGQNINVARGLTTVLSGDYSPPVGLPIITSVAPRTGPIAGGTTVTLEGANFLPGATVAFGGVSATSVTVVSGSKITAITPPRASYGTVPLVLTSGVQSVTQANGFSYLNPLGSNIELVGQFGGNVEAVAVVGNLCYYGEGTSLVITDFTNSAAPVERGRIPLPGIVRGITLSGSTAYVASQNAGVYAVDVSSASAPSILGFFDTAISAQSIAIDGTLAYVADATAGMVIIDVTNATQMFQVGSIDTAGYAQQIAFETIGSDKYVFVAESDLALRVIRVTVPSAPVEITSVPAQSSGGLVDVKIDGTTLYVSDRQAGVKIFNASNPVNLVQIGLRGNVGPSTIDVVGNRLYTSGSWLRVSDLSVLPTPTPLGLSDYGAGANDLVVSNNLAFAATGESGLQVVSVGNPASISLRSQIEVIGSVEEVMVSGSVALVGNGDGLHTVDVTNAARPVRMASLAGDRVTEIVVTGGKATLVNYGDEIVRIANVANPSVLSLLGTYSAVEAWNVALFGGAPVLAAATKDAAHYPKIDVLNLASPSNPQSSGSLLLDSISDYADSIDIRGTWAFVGRSYNSLDVVNLTNVTSPQKISSLPSPNFYGDVATSEDGNTLYIPDSLAGFKILNVSNKANPTTVGTVAAPLDEQPGLRHLHVSGRFLFAHSGRVRRLLYVFEISNPLAPVLVAHYNNAGLANSIHVVGDLIYLSDDYGGVSILRLLDVDKPTVAITTPTTNTSYPSTNSLLTLGGTATDLQGVVRVTWENDRGGGGVAQGTNAWTIPSLQLAAGVNVLTVTAEDAQGNLARDNITVTATLPENSGPALLVTGPQASPAFTFADSSLPLTGTAADVSGVQSVAWTNDRGGSGTATGTTEWSANIPLLYGPNLITLTAQDCVGNESQSELLVTFVPPDTTAPRIEILFPTATSEFATAEPILNVSGEASDDHGLKRITWSNNRGGAGTASDTSPWAANGILLQPGLNSVTMMAEDEAGNISEDNLAVTYTPSDADTDGLPDAWEREHFGVLGLASAGSDTGNTGTSDFLKHAFGIHPISPDLRGLPHMESQLHGGALGPVFKYRRLIAPGGLMYRVGVSWNLRDWDWSGTEIEQVGIPTPTGDGITEEVTVRLTNGNGTAPDTAFFRLHVLIPPEDTDGDAIDDAWEQQHFGNLDETGQGSDQGNTGIPDFLKFAFGMNPAAPERIKLPTPSVVNGAGGREFQYQYHRLISPGLLTYQVGVSDDLTNWDWSGRQLESADAPLATGDGLTERVTLSLRVLPATGSKFLRLRVIGGR